MDALLRPGTARALTAVDDDEPGRRTLCGAGLIRTAGVRGRRRAGAGRRTLAARLGYGIALFGGSWTGVPEFSLALTETGREYIHA